MTTTSPKGPLSLTREGPSPKVKAFAWGLTLNSLEKLEISWTSGFKFTEDVGSPSQRSHVHTIPRKQRKQMSLGTISKTTHK